MISKIDVTATVQFLVRTVMPKEDNFEFFNEGLSVKSFTVFSEMRKKGEQVDVTIKCGDQSFPAHRLVLSAAIPYFRMMFDSNISESKKQEIAMKQIDPLALECLIDYAYVSRVKITEANVRSLVLTSEFLQITEVKDSCCLFLSERISPDNAISIKVFAENANCSSLAESAKSFITENFDDVCDTADFLTMPFEFVTDLITRDDLHTESEEKVFEAVMKWVKADSKRTSLLQELLAVVRMPLLTPEYLVTRVSKEELIRTSIPCRDLVDEAKHNHLLRNTAVEKKDFAPKDRLWKTKNLKKKENVSSRTYAPQNDWSTCAPQQGWSQEPSTVTAHYRNIAVEKKDFTPEDLPWKTKKWKKKKNVSSRTYAPQDDWSTCAPQDDCFVNRKCGYVDNWGVSISGDGWD